MEISQKYNLVVRWPRFFDHLAYVRVSLSNGQKNSTVTKAKITTNNGCDTDSIVWGLILFSAKINKLSKSLYPPTVS